MSRKIILLGVVLVLVGCGYAFYQWLQPTTATPIVTNLPAPAVLDELPQIVQPVIPNRPTATPTATRPTGSAQPPQKLVLLAQSATPGQNSSDPHIKQGKLLLAKSRFEDARASFKQANQQDPVALYYLGMMASYFAERENSVNFFNALKAQTNVDSKLLDNAQKMLDTYTLFDTYQDGRPEFLGTLIAKQFLVLGEVELAIGKLRYLEARNPDYVDINTLLGAALLTKGDYEDAITILSKALPSERPEVYYWLGVAHLYQQSFSKAVAAFQLALNKGYKPVFKPHEKMGDAYLALNNFEAAVEEYRAAFNSAEGAEYVDLYVRPVWILLDKLKRPAEALDIANQAVIKVPRNAMSYNLVAWAQLGLKNFPAAKAALDKALELDASLSAAHLNLGSYYEATGDSENARTSYQKAVTFDKPGSSIGAAARSRLQRLIVPTSATVEPAFNAVP